MGGGKGGKVGGGGAPGEAPHHYAPIPAPDNGGYRFFTYTHGGVTHSIRTYESNEAKAKAEARRQIRDRHATSAEGSDAAVRSLKLPSQEEHDRLGREFMSGIKSFLGAAGEAAKK